MSRHSVLLPSRQLLPALVSFAAISGPRGHPPAVRNRLPEALCGFGAATGPSRPARGFASDQLADSAVRIVASDNRSPGGTLRHGVLTLRLDLCRGRWFPEADTGPSEIVLAFAETGHRPQIPGPLIRSLRGR